MKRVGTLAACALGMLAFAAGPAVASNNFAAGGAATEITQPVHNNVWDLVSNTGNVPTSDDYSGLDKPITGNRTLSTITSLSTDYYVQAGDCGGGSPRFQLEMDTNNDGSVDGSIFVYLGDTPSFNCPQSFQRWKSTGNLMSSPDARFDSSQLTGGSYGKTAAQTLATFGSKRVLYVDLVVDGGWAVGGNQDVLVDDPAYNGNELGNPFGGASKATVPTRHHVFDMDSNTGDVPTANDYSYLSYTQTKTLLFSALTQLSTDYYVQAGDCGGGSPRFSIGLDTNNDNVADAHIAVYIGNAPSFNCPSAFQRWQSTGNVIGSPDLRFDTTQLAGGTFYDSHAHALSLAGSDAVTGVSLVVDAGWAFGPTFDQDVWVDDFSVNGNILSGS